MGWVVRGRAGGKGVADRCFGDDSFSFSSQVPLRWAVYVLFFFCFVRLLTLSLFVILLGYVYSESTFFLSDSPAVALQSVLARIEGKVNPSIVRQR